MDLRDSWRANWEVDGLHIFGTTDLFPNDFSTVQLQLESHDQAAGLRTYRLAFFRDKEPFCTKDLVGPVHHFDQSAPRDIRFVRVLSPTGFQVGACAVPPADP